MKEQSYRDLVKERIFTEMNGLETEEEALAFAEYAVDRLGSSFSAAQAKTLTEPLAKMLYRETHSIYGHDVFDYPLLEANRDASRILEVSVS